MNLLNMFNLGVRRIGMGYKFNLSQLESAFSNNFSSYIYTILADKYLSNNDLSRAYTVAKIGNESHPDDISGKYILAKIYLLKNQIKEGHQLLEEILDRFPLHLNARKLLIEIFKNQNNNKKLDYHILELQKYFPNEASIQSEPASAMLIEDEKKDEGKNVISASENKEKVNIEINNNMATFTFVDILISQKHYENALEVLKILENNGRNKERIQKKRADIKQKSGK